MTDHFPPKTAEDYEVVGRSVAAMLAHAEKDYQLRNAITDALTIRCSPDQMHTACHVVLCAMLARYGQAGIVQTITDFDTAHAKCVSQDER